jgi:hypothetical protein
MAEQRDRHLAATVKKEKVANAMNTDALTAAVTASPWSGSSSIPRAASPSTPGFFNDPGSSKTQFSPHYVDIAPHNGFNPNAMFSPEVRRSPSTRTW